MESADRYQWNSHLFYRISGIVRNSDWVWYMEHITGKILRRRSGSFIAPGSGSGSYYSTDRIEGETDSITMGRRAYYYNGPPDIQFFSFSIKKVAKEILKIKDIRYSLD